MSILRKINAFYKLAADNKWIIMEWSSNLGHGIQKGHHEFSSEKDAEEYAQKLQGIDSWMTPAPRYYVKKIKAQ